MQGQEIVKITEAAAFQIKEMMKQNEEEGATLRVTVHGGGAAAYPMAWDLTVISKTRTLSCNNMELI